MEDVAIAATSFHYLHAAIIFHETNSYLLMKKTTILWQMYK